MNAHCIGVVVGCGLAVLSALAQPEDVARPSFSRLLNIDALIDNHARFLARRYNLSADQEEYTRAFLHEKADAFLGKHREELYSLVDRLVEVRAGAEMDQQELVAWGQRARPLYEEAKALIVEGNNEWRRILTDEQRKVHDEDLREMYNSFATTEDQLQRIVSGQMTLDEFRRGPGRSVPPAPRVSAAPVTAATPVEPGPAPTATESAPPPAPPTPGPTPSPAGERVRARPSAGSGAPAPAGPPTADREATPRRVVGRSEARPGERPTGGSSRAGSADFESQWEAYVREFIERYRLDDAQTQRAHAILRSCQEQARSIMTKRKAEIERIDKKIQSLGGTTDANKAKELAELNEQRGKLFEPIGEIFEKQLKPKLDNLPTRAQRQAVEGGPKKAPASPAKPEPAGRAPPPPPRRPGVQPERPAPPPPPAPPAEQPQQSEAPGQQEADGG